MRVVQRNYLSTPGLSKVASLCRKHPVCMITRRRVITCRFGLQGSGFRIQGSGSRNQDSGFRVKGSGSRVKDSLSRVEG